MCLDKKVRYKGEEIDGVIGVIWKEIKEFLVVGVLYFCYMVWYLVYGEVKDRIVVCILVECKDEIDL